MSIASKLAKLETDIDNAYTVINNKGGTIPNYKNTENLATAIASISGGTASLQNKSITITENGNTSVTADLGYDGLSNVSITTNVSGGSVDDYEYDGWIAYGTSTPDVTEYKYWLPVPTTPQNSPLKQVSGYKIDNYFDGETENLVNSETASSYYSSSIKPLDVAYYNGIYYYLGHTNTYSAVVSKYTYSNQSYPMVDITSTSTSTQGMDRNSMIKNLLATTPSSSQKTSYGTWLIEDGVFYYFETVNTDGSSTAVGNDRVEYRSLSGGSTTYLYCGKNALALESQKNRALGLFKIDSTHYVLLMYNTSATSTLKIYKLNCATSSSGTSSTLLQSLSLSSASVYGCKKLDSETMLITPNGTSSYSTSTYKVIAFNTTSNTYEYITYPTGSTSFTCTYLMPENKLVYRFNHDTHKLYEIVKINGSYQFNEITIGNIFGGVLNQGLSSLLYVSITNNIFRSRILNSMTFKYNGTSYTAQFINAVQQYNVIQYLTNKNAVIEIDSVENINSSNNVLIISNYLNNTSNMHYKFYPRENSNIFLPMLRDSTNGAIVIYNKSIYYIKVSKNNEWVSVINDSDNYIK